MARGRRPSSPTTIPGGAADAAEIVKFDRLAERWWDEDGPMAPLQWVYLNLRRRLTERPLRRTSLW